MTEQTAWILAIAAVLAAALIGFFVGRQFSGAKERLEALESENSRQKDEISGYKREVETHFDKTATLFASMAGSYKDLFEHLSSGYERLSEGSARELFRDRIAALLLEGGKGGKDGNKLLDDGVKSPSPAFEREGFDKPVGSAAAVAGAAGAVAAEASDAEEPAPAADASAAAPSGEGRAGKAAPDDAATDEIAGDEASPAAAAKKEVGGDAAETGEGQGADAAAAAPGSEASSEDTRSDVDSDAEALHSDPSGQTVRRGDDTR